MHRFQRIAAGIAGLAAPWWSASGLRRYQSRRLRALVRHCWQEVPFYRERLKDAGIDPRSFRGLDDLPHLPIITRADLQAASPAVTTARSAAGVTLVTHRTSGSSGAPLSIRRTVSEEWLLRAFRLESQLQHGLRPWHRIVSVSRRRAEVAGISRPWTRWGILRRETIDCTEGVPEVSRKVLAFAPDALSGFSGSIAGVAGFLGEGQGRGLHLRYLGCGAETVTPEMRETIEAAFGRRLSAGYAACEFNLIAADCGRQPFMHVAGGAVIVEVLRDGHPVAEGNAGEVVATALHSFAMPFLRYRLGDWVRRGPDRCPCGAPFATLSEIQGRTIEMFHLPDGRQMHPYMLVKELVNNAPWVRQYQLVQEQPDLIRARIVGLAQASEVERLDVAARLAKACGGIVRIDLEAVETIPPEASGKYRPYYRRFES